MESIDRNSPLLEKRSIELDIIPNFGLNDIKLGDKLYNIMNQLNKTNKFNIEFKYNDVDNSTFVVSVKELNTNLLFDSIRQQLLLIDINICPQDNDNNSFKYKYKYKNEIINQEDLDFKQIYNKYFGPTYSGNYNIDDCNYYLSYTGLAFKFPSNKEGNEETSNDVESLTNEKILFSKDIFKCSSILIFKNVDDKQSSWFDFTNSMILALSKPITFSSLKELNTLSPLPIKNDYKNKDLIIIEKLNYSSETKTLSLNFDKHPDNILKFQLVIGETSMSTIVKNLGDPDDFILKRKLRSVNSQLKKIKGNFEGNEVIFKTNKNYIPNSLYYNINRYRNIKDFKSENSDTEIIKIHNYFNFGFDIVYNLDVSVNGDNIVSSIIFHNNTIESVDFLKYNRNILFFNSIPITDNFESIKAKHKFQNNPIFLDRKEYNIQEYFEAEKEETDRFFQLVDHTEDSINDVSNNDLQLWGLSSYDNDVDNTAIFEVLQSSNNVSTVTIY